MTAYQRIREANKGIAQQMILWGHDVKHPQGNLLQRFGMTRHESTGLKGTSCYRMPWEDGWVQLHGACAGWFHSGTSETPGCLYQRTSRRIKLWHGNHAPVPGQDDGKNASPEVIWQSAQPFLRWLLAYEAWVISECGIAWRQQTWRAQFSLTKKNPWWPPQEALAWWHRQVMPHSMAPAHGA
jgi:hypothetical protein